MTSDAKQMAANFIETLENLQKTLFDLDKEDIKDIASLIFKKFDGEEVIDAARIIILMAGGAKVCYTCGSQYYTGCNCEEEDKDVLSIFDE